MVEENLVKNILGCFKSDIQKLGAHKKYCQGDIIFPTNSGNLFKQQTFKFLFLYECHLRGLRLLQTDPEVMCRKYELAVILCGRSLRTSPSTIVTTHPCQTIIDQPGFLQFPVICPYCAACAMSGDDGNETDMQLFLH